MLPERDAWGERLPRHLGLWSAVAVLIGSTIGSGIFRIPGSIAAYTGTVGGMMLVWVAGGLVTVCGALSLAEVAALFPKAGGIYVYLHEAYGRLTAFLFGWLILIISPALNAAVALVFGEYIGRLYGEAKGRPEYIVARTVGTRSDGQ